jgi:hypothetical protein
MLMPRPLLDRQVSLLAYLTSGAAIFGDGAAAAGDPALQGIDRGSLHLEARLSHDKRMEKIAAIFRKTFVILEGSRNTVVRAFAETCPPVGTGRMENARQFRDFLFARGADAPFEPAHLQDVAAFEFACATARIRGGDQALEAEKAGTQPPGWLRRGSEVVLLRCEYDLRTIFEDGSDRAVPVRRDTPLAISFPPGAASPQIFELAPIGFDLLARMDDWTDPVTLGDSPELKELLCDLAQHGLIDPPP